jgi:hypothetical protein
MPCYDTHALLLARIVCWLRGDGGESPVPQSRPRRLPSQLCMAAAFDEVRHTAGK